MATAAALMIGIALVSTVGVLGASMKESITASIDKSLRADFIVSGIGFAPLSSRIAERMEQAPELGSVTPLRLGSFKNGANIRSVSAADGGVFVSSEEARARNLQVGDRINMRFARTGDQTMVVEGIFGSTDGIGSGYLISLGTWEENFSDRLDFRIFATTAPGVSRTEARTALDAIERRSSGMQTDDQAEFKQSQEDAINETLGLITALLGLALVIAVLGITNALALSVFERTRELGLLRAVGMSRTQTRAMVRWESVILAVLGALLGLMVGSFFGWALVASLSSEGVTEFAVPLSHMAGYVAAAGAVGVLAGMPPARRAARLDVLEAITAE